MDPYGYSTIGSLHACCDNVNKVICMSSLDGPDSHTFSSVTFALSCIPSESIKSVLHLVLVQNARTFYGSEGVHI